ncbi:MAG TPA: trypsin-like peptidase domain-containing protein, partial [Pseudonocardia sp.]|nr:trypsin-like peptidase domain-containing protein [Pseudonocardia sp.]
MSDEQRGQAGPEPGVQGDAGVPGTAPKDQQPTPPPAAPPSAPGGVPQWGRPPVYGPGAGGPPGFPAGWPGTAGGPGLPGGGPAAGGGFPAGAPGLPGSGPAGVGIPAGVPGLPGTGPVDGGSTAHEPGHGTGAERPRRRRGFTTVVAAALIAGLVGGAGGFGGAYALLDGGTPTPTLTSAPATSPASNATPGSVAAAASIASPSTVDIRVRTAQGVAEGSGVVLTPDGAVLTNNHVVSGASGPITVTLADGSERTATVVGSAPSYDLAVLRIEDASGLTAATLGRSADVQVGQQVVAIGSPQGLSGTVTTGIVSALDRTVAVQGDDGSAVVYNGLQTDAPINQGNSGGPLVNLDGQVIGINSAIATAGQSTGSIGLGFAIPVDQARRVAQEILDDGVATKPVLGVEGGLAGGPGDETGAAVTAVRPGSPAADAGLTAGEVVTKVDDATVEDFADLVARIGSYAPG